ncbi:Molybdopterin biosynthesis MoaE [Phyllosticta citrichinensis]
MANPSGDMVREDDVVHVELTYDPLDAVSAMNRVKSPKAGAVVLFAGTTRDNFANKAVASLTYTAYVPLALRTLYSLASDLVKKHDLTAISMTHRLGPVPIGEESILIAVSSPHRQAAWRAGEEALEVCKEKVEVWKLERFVGEEGGMWKANRDGVQGVWVPDKNDDDNH